MEKLRKRWTNIKGEDVADFIIKRMDELDALEGNPNRKQEVQGHNDELQIIADHLRRLNEDREKAEAAPVPPTYFFLTVARAEEFPEAPSSKAAVLVQYEVNGKDITREIKTMREYHDFFTARREAAKELGLEITIMASSSMDFPHDYSEEDHVIDLARAIRSNKVTA